MKLSEILSKLDSEELKKILEIITADPDFAKFNWHEVAKMMDGEVIRIEKDRVEIFVNNENYEIWDNGGEVNITKRVRAVKYSVPYANNEGRINDGTLGYRLITAIKGKKIDYNFKV